MPHIISSIIRLAVLTGLAGVLLLGPPGGQGPVKSAAAQAVAVSGDFRIALEPYGSWRRHRRFGEVWIPANLSRSWRPYTVGHWVYTDDYGWYWAVDDQEAAWGWIVYHYGRWYFDPDEGWIWIPNNVWGPAWVDWRYGDQYVGWAPEPPDEFVEAEDDPTYWNFVAASDLTAPAIATVLLPFQRREEFFSRTVVVNRPLIMQRSGQQFAVNPGIAPGTVAAIRGRPLPAFNVRPRVLAGTAALPGAIQVRAEDLRRERELGNRPGAPQLLAARDVIRPSSTVIRPARTAAQPQPLARGEAGRLAGTPLRAARGATVVERAAQRVTGTPSAQQQRGEQRQTAVPPRGREVAPGGGNITSPNAPPRATTQAPAMTRPGPAEQRAVGRERNQPPTTVERRLMERPPVARAPLGNQGVVQRGPAARAPVMNRPPSVAARPPMINRPPPVAAAPRPAPPPVAARPPMINRPPPVAAAPRPAPPPVAARPPMINRPPPVAAAPRPAPPPVAARPPMINRPPPVAAAPRPAPPPAAAARPAFPPATMGAAPRGGPGQRRQ